MQISDLAEVISAALLDEGEHSMVKDTDLDIPTQSTPLTITDWNNIEFKFQVPTSPRSTSDAVAPNNDCDVKQLRGHPDGPMPASSLQKKQM